MRRLEAARPLGKAVQRPARKQDVAQQHAEPDRGGKFLASVAGVDALEQDALDGQPPEKVVQQRQGPTATALEMS